MKVKIIITSIFFGLSSSAYAGNQWIQTVPGDTQAQLAEECGTTVQEFQKVNGTTLKSAVKCPSSRSTETAVITDSEKSTEEPPLRRHKYSRTEGSVGGEYRTNRHERQSQIKGDVTRYTCESQVNGTRDCEGPRFFGQYREAERKKDGKESELVRLRAGKSWRQYYQDDLGRAVRDTSTLSAEVAHRSNSTMLNAHGELERKIQVTDKTAGKIAVTGRVPVANLNDDYRNTTALGLKGELQHDFTKNVKGVGSLGLWHSFRNGGVTSLTPKAGLRFNDDWEAGLGLELIDGKSPTDIFYAKKYFSKDDGARRQASHIYNQN